MGMVLNLHLARVAVLLVAACLAPSLAYAHAGHAHHAPAAHVTPVATDVASTPAAAAQEHADRTIATIEVRSDVANASQPSSDLESSHGCKTRCCGAGDGMTCCGLALVPELATAPAPFSSHRITLAGVETPLGVAPDALPEPPKPFA
jgi:hypothetical protein